MMDDSSDTDLSSSEDSFQSCLDNGEPLPQLADAGGKEGDEGNMDSSLQDQRSDGDRNLSLSVSTRVGGSDGENAEGGSESMSTTLMSSAVDTGLLYHGENVDADNRPFTCEQDCLQEQTQNDDDSACALGPSPCSLGLSDRDVSQGTGRTITTDVDTCPAPEAGAGPLPSTSHTESACICESLRQVLHDGCRAKKEMACSTEQGKFDTLFNHFQFVRSSLDSLQSRFHTSNPYECPTHGVLPPQVSQSRCHYCIDADYINEFERVACGDAEAYPWVGSENNCEAMTGVYSLDADSYDHTGHADAETDPLVCDRELETLGMLGFAGNAHSEDSKDGDCGDAQSYPMPAVEGDFEVDSHHKFPGDGVCDDDQIQSLTDLDGDFETGTSLATIGDNDDNASDLYVNVSDDNDEAGNPPDEDTDAVGFEGKRVGGLDSDTGDTGHTATSSVGGQLSPEEKEKRKVLSKAGKKVLKLNQKIQAALEERDSKERMVQDRLELMETNRKEAEKSLADHVNYLKTLLDHYQRQQQEALTQRHRKAIEHALVSQTEGLNYKARMVDVQKRVEAQLSRIYQHRDVSAADPDDITALTNAFNACIGSKPSSKIITLTYTVEIPQVTSDELQSLLGHFIVTADAHDNATQRHQTHPPPAGGTPGQSYAHPTGTKAPPNQGVSGKDSARKTSKSVSSNPSETASSERSASEYEESGSAKRPPASKPASSATAPASGKGPGVTAARAWKRSPLLDGVLASQRPQPAAAPRKNPSSLGNKDKLSETMASTTSLASTTSVGSVTSSKAEKRARSRARRKKKKVEAAEAALPPKPVSVTLLHYGAQPTKIKGRGVEPSGLAARSAREVWVVYGVRNPNLDLVNAEGDMIESTRVGGNAMAAASFNEEDVLVSFHSPCCQVKLLDAQKEERGVFKVPMTSSGLGVGSTGIAVSGYKSLYWHSLDGGDNEWIVKEKGSALKCVCSCDVFVLGDREVVCLADRDGHKVWFYEKLHNGEFAPLPLFTYAVQGKEGKATTTPFTPVSVSALAGSSFVAVLDSTSLSVIIVDVEKNEAVSVIPKKQLCQGTPSVIAFALTKPDEEPRLWVGSSNGNVYLVFLAFLYQ